MVAVISIIIIVVNSIIFIIITAIIRISSFLEGFPTLKYWTFALYVIHFNSVQYNTY